MRATTQAGGGWLRGAESPHCCGSLACARWSTHVLPPDVLFLELGGAPLLHGGGVLSYVTGIAFAFFIGCILVLELFRRLRQARCSWDTSEM